MTTRTEVTMINYTVRWISAKRTKQVTRPFPSQMAACEWAVKHAPKSCSEIKVDEEEVVS